jgi:hypothetical protein
MNTPPLSRYLLRVIRLINFYMVSEQVPWMMKDTLTCPLVWQLLAKHVLIRIGSLDNDGPFPPDVGHVFGQKLPHVRGCVKVSTSPRDT